MHREDTQFPFRQATRVVNEYQHNVSSIWLDLVGRRLDRMVVLLLILRNALRPNATSAISVHALATSLRRPPETIRRHVQALSSDGFCKSQKRTMHLDPMFLEHPEIVEHTKRLVEHFVRMLDGFKETGFTLPTGIRERKPRAILVAALDIYLSALELSESRLGDSLDLYVAGAITVHNAAAITHDRVLAERYGYSDTVPPEELRRPISIRALAVILGFPYATIWRHVVAIERLGIIRRVPEGYLLSDEWMDSERTNELSRSKIRYVRRVLNDLAASA